ncbi:MAG: twin-arginine translocase TatA/TatE family subunit [Bdellovibrionaceae bacterium]|nr:twin-arginine translocase TatA/TatE family subunit [Pseudobdellovibrionaceae bacterium]
MGGLSFSHILLLAIILLIIFGPSRLPQLGQSLGKAIRGFKEGLNEIDGQHRDVSRQQPPPQQIPHTQSTEAHLSQSVKSEEKPPQS